MDRTFAPLGFCLALIIALPVAAAECKLTRVAQLPVTMAGTRPMIAGTVNAMPARFLLDTGAFFSLLTRASADKFHLKLRGLPWGFRVGGISGSADTRLVTADDFTLTGFGTGTLHRVDFLVGGNVLQSEADGLIGQNVLGRADTEFDLANGLVSLFKPQDCAHQMLAYWWKDGGIAEMSIDRTSELSPLLVGSATLNGERIRVLFDSGAFRSALTVRAAARAGVKPEDAGVISGGPIRGLGSRVIETWIGRFDNLDLGGEQIKNGRVRFGKMDLPEGTDMLLGADFFLSHRIYVAVSQHKIYFTFNGGQVFDLRNDHEVEASAKDAPTDAAGFRRRGAAAAGRHEFRAALADLDEAVRREPQEAENYYQRADALWRDQKFDAARADADQAIKLRPDDVPTLILRASLRLEQKDDPGALADFDKAASLAPDDPGVGLRIARIYLSTGHYEMADSRLTAWISKYRKDDRLPAVLTDRCWARVWRRNQSDLALADCNAALDAGPKTSQLLGVRATVLLMRGDTDRALSDYRTSVAMQPKGAWSLFGLGVTEMRKGRQEDGRIHIKAATQLDSAVATKYAQLGLSPAS